jgi:two-component system cell cycle sensor histidine kinase/response regulator CckA
MKTLDQQSLLRGTPLEPTDENKSRRLSQKSTGAGDPAPQGEGELILMVDDDNAWIWIGEKILSSLGYRVMKYTDPAEALSFFRIQPQVFDLVITDLNMPVLNGVSFGTKLLQMRPDLPIILMTSEGGITRQEIQQLGFRDLLLKPELAANLGSVVSRVLNRATGDHTENS